MVLVALALIATLALPAQAEAFDKHSEYCLNDVTRSPVYVGPEWDLFLPNDPGKRLREPMQDGYETWLFGPRDYLGSPVFGPGGGFAMGFVDGALINGATAVTVCSLNPLRLIVGQGIKWNRDKLAEFLNRSWDYLQGYSAHEWGHAWGLGHSGRFDSFGQDFPPTLATCLTVARNEDRATLSQDDYAGSSYLSEDQGGYNSVTANDSFEHDTSFWGRWAGTPLSTVPNGVNGSPTAGRIGPSINKQSIYNSTRVTDLQNNHSDGNVTGDTFFARANVRDEAHRDGYVIIKAWARGVRYKDKFSLGCNFYGDDKNNLEKKGSWISSSVICFPVVDHWNYCDTPSLSPPLDGMTFDDNGNDNPDAVDVRVRLWNRVVDQGNPSIRLPVLVDRVRIKYDF